MATKPTLIPTSLSLDLRIGDIAAIAAAPQTPVPTPNNKTKLLSPLMILFKNKINNIAKATTPTSSNNNVLP